MLKDKLYLRAHYERCSVRPEVTCGKGRHTLASGQHGKVKLAYSHAHGCFVAVKCQPLDHLLDRRRSAWEQRLHEVLKLPHIVPILDIAESAHKRYIVVELGHPVDLRGMTLSRACHIMHQVILGIDELQALGVYHRDIKLDNIVEISTAAATTSAQQSSAGSDRSDSSDSFDSSDRSDRSDSAKHTDPTAQQSSSIIKLIDFGKAAYAPGSWIQPTYAWVDANRAALLFETLLQSCDRQLARQFGHWFRGVAGLRLCHLKAHPLLAHSFYAGRAYPVIRGWSWVHRCLYPLKRLWECITSYVPLLCGSRRVPTADQVAAVRGLAVCGAPLPPAPKASRAENHFKGGLRNLYNALLSNHDAV